MPNLATEDGDDSQIDDPFPFPLPRDYFDKIPLPEPPPVRSLARLSPSGPVAEPVDRPEPPSLIVLHEVEADESAAEAPEAPVAEAPVVEVPVVEVRVMDVPVVEVPAVDMQVSADVPQPQSEPEPEPDLQPEAESNHQTRIHEPISSPSPARAAALAAGAVILLLLGAVILLLFGAAIGRLTAPPSKATVPAPPSASPADVRRLGTELARLGASVNALATRQDELRHRLDTLPAPAVPDLSPLEARIEALNTELAKISASAETTPTRLDSLAKDEQQTAKAAAALSIRLDHLNQTIATLQNEVRNATEPSWSRGVDLFKNGQYSAARDIFARLREAHLDDARLWYYSALANGFATGQWDGETERLVTQGTVRERAGSPPAREIDAAFTSLAPAGAKTWLDSYRKRAQRP